MYVHEVSLGVFFLMVLVVFYAVWIVLFDEQSYNDANKT